MRSGARPNISERVWTFPNASERFWTRPNGISDVISDKLVKSKISERISGGPKKPEFSRFFHEFWTRKFFLKMTPMSRDRHAFSELYSFIKKRRQICFRIEICAIKNLIVKKNRIKNAFSLEKLSLFEYTKCPWEMEFFKGKTVHLMF